MMRRRARGAVAVVIGTTVFVVWAAAYFTVTSIRGLGEPMSVSLGRTSPLVFVSTAQAPEIEACVTPRSKGQRTQVQVDGLNILATPRNPLGDAPLGCSGTAFGVSPQVLAPGLHRLTFTALYSGRYERRVGVTVAVGPFEDRERWIPCAARLWIGQDFLDAPGDDTPDLARAIEHMLLRRRFTDPCLTGSVVDADVGVYWTKSGLTVTVTMRLNTGDVIRTKAELVLSSRGGHLHVSAPPSSLSASLAGPALTCAHKKYSRQHAIIAFLFEDRVAKEIQSQADERVLVRSAQMIEQELLAPVREVLLSPRPLQLADSKKAQLAVRYGDLHIEYETGALLCLDLRAATEGHVERIVPGPPRVPLPSLPPLLVRSQSLRIDLSLRAMNAALDAAWRVGVLDRLLNESSATWAELFKDLTVRPTAMAFELPPVIQPGKAGPEVTVGNLRVWLADREHPERPPRVADLWARADLSATFVQSKRQVQLAAHLRDFGMSCQEGNAQEQRLQPCFSEAVQMFGNTLLDQPIAADAVGTVMVPLEKWLPGQPEGRAALAVDLKRAELRPMAGGAWYQLFADVGVRDAQER